MLMSIVDKFKQMTTKKKIILGSVSAFVIVAAVVAFIMIRSYLNSGYVATTMRLLRVEGTVSIEDSEGNSKPVIDNIRFESGDALTTGSDGLASVGLDDTKIVTLQNDSRAEFTKKGKKLELKLTKGAVFFEVTEKLDDDESFEIKTSTMVVGIRGTSGYVFYDEDGREALIITDGKVQVIATNPDTMESKTTEVLGGQMVKVYLYDEDREEGSVDFFLDNLEEDEVPAFTLQMLAENPDLLDKVCADTGWDRETILALVEAMNSGDVEEQTLTPTATPTLSPTKKPTVTPSDTPTPSPTRAPNTTPTNTPTPTEAPEASPSVSPSPSPSEEPSPSVSPSVSPSNSPTTSPTVSPSETPSPSPDPSVSPSTSPTATPTNTNTPTPKPTNTDTPTPTPTMPDFNGVPDEDTEIPEGFEPDADFWGKTYDNHNVYIISGQPPEEEGSDEMYFKGFIDGEWKPLKLESDDEHMEFSYTTSEGETYVYFQYFFSSTDEPLESTT